MTCDNGYCGHAQDEKDFGSSLLLCFLNDLRGVFNNAVEQSMVSERAITFC